MELVSNKLLVKVRQDASQLKLKSGLVLYLADWTDKSTNPDRVVDVIKVPEYIPLQYIQDMVSEKLVEAYEGIDLTKPMCEVGDTLLLHPTSIANARNLGWSWLGKDLDPTLEPDSEYCLLNYDPVNGIWIVERDGEIFPFGYKMFIEQVIDPIFQSSIIIAPPELAKERPFTASVVNPGMNTNFSIGDTIYYHKYANMKVKLGDKDFIILDGIVDVVGKMEVKSY